MILRGWDRGTGCAKGAVFSFAQRAPSLSCRAIFSLSRRAIISESLFDGLAGCVCCCQPGNKGIRVIAAGGGAITLRIWHGCGGGGGGGGDAKPMDTTECCGDVPGDARAWFLDAILGGWDLRGVCFMSAFFCCCLVAVLIEAGSLVLAVQDIVQMTRLYQAIYEFHLPFPTERRPCITFLCITLSWRNWWFATDIVVVVD